MSRELELWQFVASCLAKNEGVMLLVVAASSGSSPGRAGYKMAVAADGELYGSIGGGVMEVELGERAKAILSEPGTIATGFGTTQIIEQVHQENAPNASGMICSGRQTVILRQIAAEDSVTVRAVIRSLEDTEPASLTITSNSFTVGPPKAGTPDISFEKVSEDEFVYVEKLGVQNKLIIIGGGHCALALSGVMSKLDFHIRIFDDRPELSTLEKNQFADDITIIDSYDTIAENLPPGDDHYVVVMTLGYRWDEIVIRQLFDRDFKYFGVLGSRAKMKTLLYNLEKDGFDKDRLSRIRTPVGININSRTPEEIAISIAAEMISVKNR